MKNYAPVVLIIILVLPLLAFLFFRFFSTQVYRSIPYVFDVVEGDTVHYKVPTFSLTDISGRQISHKDVEDNITIISFFDRKYGLGTKVLNGNLKRVYRNVEETDFIKLLSVSLDTSELSSYVDSMDVSSNTWLFLQGDTSEVIRLAEGIGFSKFKENLLKNEVSGSNEVAVIDKKGMVRYHFIGTDLADIKKLNEELRALVLLEYPEEVGKKSSSK